MLPKEQVSEYESVEKWTEIDVGEEKIDVLLEKPLLGDFEDPEDFIMDARIYKVLKWNRSHLFLRYK